MCKLANDRKTLFLKFYVWLMAIVTHDHELDPPLIATNS